MSSIALSPSVASPSSASIGSRAVDWGRYARVGLATVVAAVLANVLVYYVGEAVVGYDPDFVVLANPSGAVLFTLVPAAVATFLYAGLLRFASHPDRDFSIISAVVFVVTTIPDFTYIPGVEGASNGQTAVLVLMHIVAAAVIIGMLTKLAGSRAR